MSADEQKITIPAVAADDAIVTEANADQERSEKILKAKELYSHGSRNFLVKSYAEAADELSQVCALYEELYGELSDELGMPYLLYAKSLIALALDENKVIDVPDEEDDDDEDDDDDDAVDDMNDVAATSNGEAVAKPTNGSAAKLQSIREVESVVAKTTKKDEADSTESSCDKKTDATVATAAVEEKVAVDSSVTDKEKTDEAVVTSTDAEDAAAAVKTTKNGNANGNSNAEVTAAAVAVVDVEKPSTSNGEAVADDEDEDNEAASSLQLAWEILELAAKIFSRQGLSGLPNLAEVQTELANIEFENNILVAAREDYEKALKIYNGLPKSYRRAMAEIHYKIGLTYLMEQLNKEGAASLKEACNLIEGEIVEMKSMEEATEKDKNNIQDMEETKQEILAKIVEIEDTQAQQIADVRAALDNFIKPAGTQNADGAGPSSSTASVSAAAADAKESACASTATITSSSKPTDISHLIKRKKPEEPSSEAEAAAASPAKRPAA